MTYSDQAVSICIYLFESRWSPGQESKQKSRRSEFYNAFKPMEDGVVPVKEYSHVIHDDPSVVEPKSLVVRF